MRRLPRRARALLGVAIAGSAFYALLLALLWFGQERLLFRPWVLPPGHRFDVAADVHERWIETPGGGRLNALHLQLPAPRGIAFYLHGNGGSLQNWFADPGVFRRAGFDLFMLDYRGYGKSPGRIRSEAELLADVRAAWAAVAPAYAGKKRVVVGRSLGTAPAAILAAEVQPELTVLVSPYASMAELAAEHYPWVPAGILRYPLRTADALARVRGDVLLVHGGHDALIDPLHSRRLQRVAPRARLVLIEDAGHDDVHRHAEYEAALSAALAR